MNMPNTGQMKEYLKKYLNWKQIIRIEKIPKRFKYTDRRFEIISCTTKIKPEVYRLFGT